MGEQVPTVENSSRFIHASGIPVQQFLYIQRYGPRFELFFDIQIAVVGPLRGETTEYCVLRAANSVGPELNLDPLFHLLLRQRNLLPCRIFNFFSWAAKDIRERNLRNPVSLRPTWFQVK